MRRNEIFNTTALNYERSRPKYNLEILHELQRLIDLTPSSKILEIGCGTGQATHLFKDLGAKIHCIDIGNELIAAAQREFAAYPRISFTCTDYESFETLEKYELIFSATAYHWIEQPGGDMKTRSLLSDTGKFALMHNYHLNTGESFFSDSQTIYDEYLPQKNRKSFCFTMNRKVFRVIGTYEYFWSENYTTKEYIDLLSTYSDHLALPKNKREQLFDKLANLINQKYCGSIEKKYKTLLEIGM